MNRGWFNNIGIMMGDFPGNLARRQTHSRNGPMSSRRLRGANCEGDVNSLSGGGCLHRILVDYDHGFDKAWHMLVD